MNGTTAYDVDNTEEVGTGFKARLLSFLTRMMGSANSAEDDGRADYDNANYDMLIDNAPR